MSVDEHVQRQARLRRGPQKGHAGRVLLVDHTPSLQATIRRREGPHRRRHNPSIRRN